MTRLGDELMARLERLAAAEGMELVHAEVVGTARKPVVRLFIDRDPGGVTLADCEHVSRQASALLDAYDPMPGAFTLEVSSPGLDRKLYAPRDWVRFAGQPVRVRMRPGWQGARTIDAVVVGLQEDAAVVECLDGTRPCLPLHEILEARLAPFGPVARALEQQQGRKQKR